MAHFEYWSFDFTTVADGASWLNMVERFFRDLTAQRVRRGVFRSVAGLQTAIDAYIQQYNERLCLDGQGDILEKVKRGCATLPKLQSA